MVASSRSARKSPVAAGTRSRSAAARARCSELPASAATSIPGTLRSASTWEEPAKPVPMTATLTARLTGTATRRSRCSRAPGPRGACAKCEVHAPHLGARIVETLDALDRLRAPANELVPLGRVPVDELADPARRQLHVRELLRLGIDGQPRDPVEAALGRLLPPDPERLHQVCLGPCVGDGD